MEETINKIKNWFDSEAKNDNCFYRLYTVKFVNSSYGRKDLRSTNYITDSKEECLQKIISDITIHGATSNKYFVINHMDGKKDPHPIALFVENPFFDPGSQKTSGVNGIGNLNQNNDSMYNLMREHHQTSSQLKEEMQSLRHEHELEKMDGRIAELETGHKTAVDSISDFMQTDVGQKIVSSLTTLMSIKMQQGKQPVQPVQNEPISGYEEPVPRTQTRKTDNVDSEQVQKLNDSLRKLDEVFNGEGLIALNEIAEFCKTNPDLAQTFRKKQENA